MPYVRSYPQAMTEKISVQQSIRNALKSAMRSKNQIELAALRAIETEITLAKTASGFDGNINDALYLKTIAAYVKRMSKAKAEYIAAGDRGKEMAANLEAEIEFLSQWLPKKLDEAETKILVNTIVSDLNASDMASMGQVMGELKQRAGNTVDGKLASDLVRKALS